MNGLRSRWKSSVGALMVAAALTACASTPPGAAPAEAAALPPERAAEVVMLALNFIDTPYRRGGTAQETGFDCSGFTRHVFEQGLGFTLPRQADEQAAAPGLLRVKRSQLLPGDLVFFNTLRRRYSHVGIYVGDGRFIHAPRTGAAVRVEDMDLPYWKTRYNGARRAPAEQP
jgi:cell wall-associated NlpC family hydrolase